LLRGSAQSSRPQAANSIARRRVCASPVDTSDRPAQAEKRTPGRDPGERSGYRPDLRRSCPPTTRAAAARTQLAHRSRFDKRPVPAKNRPVNQVVQFRLRRTPEPAGQLDGAGSTVVAQAGRSELQSDRVGTYAVAQPIVPHRGTCRVPHLESVPTGGGITSSISDWGEFFCRSRAGPHGCPCRGLSGVRQSEPVGNPPRLCCCGRIRQAISSGDVLLTSGAKRR